MRLKSSKTLKQNGYRLTQNVTRSRRRINKRFQKGDFILDRESVKIFDRNIKAYKITFGSENIRPLLEKNAGKYIVDSVRPKIKRGSRDHVYTGRYAAFKILRGNMRESFQVLTHRKKFRADNVVFVGPKAIFKGRKRYAKTYGRNPKNSNAYYAPAREARFGAQIKPAIRGAAAGYLGANAMAIKRMMRP